MDFHNAAAIFPMLEGDEYEAFRDDLKMHGLKEPIVTYQGRIIDGRNRFKACRELNIKPLYTEWDGEGSLVEHVISLNLHRRHLTTNQRAMLGAKFKEALQAEARERSMANLANNPDPKISPARHKDSRDVAGDKVHTSGFNVDKAQAVLNRNFAPLTKAVEADQIAIANAADLATLPDDELRAVIGAGPDAMLAKAQEIRSDKKEAPTSPKRESQPIAQKGFAAIKKHMDATVDRYAKDTGQHAEAICAAMMELRKDLCGV